MPSSHDYRTYHVSRQARQPLLDFMVGALRACGCRVLFTSPPDEAPFRVTFETAEGERMGVVAYAFLANQRLTKNRPDDEHRFQVKYGSRDGRRHALWQDPFGLYTTLFLGINPERGFFVGADPVLHSPTRLFISIEFKEENAKRVIADGWHAWERDRRSDDCPVEVLVGGRSESFLRYIRLEREALAEDQGHRHLIAEDIGSPTPNPAVGAQPSPMRLHCLAEELELDEREVLDLIESAPRLKMAVRGWVAEEHLYRRLVGVPDVTECSRIRTEGGADIALRFAGVPLTVECKNVLRQTAADGSPRLDFQRTRASKSDPCSRYYSSADFDVVAACLHAVTRRWEFRYALTAGMARHARCPGKLTNNVRVDSGWLSDPRDVLRNAIR